MLGGMDDALQGRDLDGERERAVREDGATQLFVHFKARVLGGGGGGATRFPPDIVGRLLVRLHHFAVRGDGDGGSCGGAWQGGCILGYADNTALLQVRNLGDDGDVLDLTVWGVYPATLRNIMHRAVSSSLCVSTTPYFPGIVLKESATCPCAEADCEDAGADHRVLDLEELRSWTTAQRLPTSAGGARRSRSFRWLLPEGALGGGRRGGVEGGAGAAYLPADVAMQRLEECVSPQYDPAHELTALWLAQTSSASTRRCGRRCCEWATAPSLACCTRATGTTCAATAHSGCCSM